MVPPPPARERSRSTAPPRRPSRRIPGEPRGAREPSPTRQDAAQIAPREGGRARTGVVWGPRSHDQNDASDTRFAARPGKADGRNKAERPPAILPQTGGTAHAPPPAQNPLPSTRTPRTRPTGGAQAQARWGGTGTRPPPPKHARRSKGPGQDTRRGTDHVERPYQRPVPGPREVRTPHHPGGGGSGRRGSVSAHTHKGQAGTTRRATGPSSWNAQTAWSGEPASEGKRHPDGTARHTQRGTRGAGRGKWERDNTRYGPEPPEPAASAAHTRPGHCTRQGSSGALRHAPAPRLGSLRASPRGSHWRQASGTGPAAPAPRATTH